MDVEGEGRIVCRMCMCEEDAIFYNIFDTDSSEVESVVSKIWNCLSLEVYFGDGLPSFICHQCLYKLNSFHSFKEMCCTSYIHLRKYQCSSFVQNTIHLEDMKVESVVKKVSPVPFDSGCTVEGSEGALDDDVPEFVRHEMDNVADKSDHFSRALFSHISDESNAELEESQTTQCASDSVILLRDSYDHLQSVGPKSNVSAPEGRSLVLNQPSCPSTNHSASSQILNILKVSSGMILFPANDVLNNESSSISAILPMDNKLYSNISCAESSTDNRSASPLALQTDGCSQTLTSTTIDVSRENVGNTSWTSGKLHMRENHVKVLPERISTLSQESENCSGHINVISSKCTGYEGRRPVKMYGNRKTISHKPYSNNTGGRSFNSEVTEQLGAFGDELNVSLSTSSNVDRNKLKLNRTLKDSSNNKKSLDKPLINGTNRSSCACKECHFKL